jgi:hypothetical protein
MSSTLSITKGCQYCKNIHHDIYECNHSSSRLLLHRANTEALKAYINDDETKFETWLNNLTIPELIIITNNTYIKSFKCRNKMTAFCMWNYYYKLHEYLPIVKDRIAKHDPKYYKSRNEYWKTIFMKK